MNKPFEIEGKWWLPNSKKRKVTGKLIFTPGAILHLYLNDSLDFNPQGTSFNTGFYDQEIIQGVSNDGTSITLQTCQSMGNGMSIKNGQLLCPTNYIVSFAFLGHFFNTIEAIKFSKISIEYFNLDNWFNHPDYNFGSKPNLEKILNEPNPKQIKICLREIDVSVIFSPMLGYKQNIFSAKIKGRIFIEPKTKKLLSKYIDLIRRIQNFFTFAMDMPTFEESIFGYISKGSDEEIRIFYGSSSWRSDPVDIHWSKMLFSYLDFNEDFSSLFQKWMVSYQKLKPVLDLVFADIYSKGFPENEFLNLIQAIEGYHRRYYGGSYMDKEEYSKGLFNIFLSCIPDEIVRNSPDFYSSLKNGKLKYAYEYSFRKRVKEICVDISAIQRLNFLADNNKLNTFIDELAEERNNLVHSLDDDKLNDPDRGKKLMELIWKLRSILTICILDQLDIQRQQIVTITSRSWPISKYIEG